MKKRKIQKIEMMKMKKNLMKMVKELGKREKLNLILLITEDLKDKRCTSLISIIKVHFMERVQALFFINLLLNLTKLIVIIYGIGLSVLVTTLSTERLQKKKSKKRLQCVMMKLESYVQ